MIAIKNFNMPKDCGACMFCINLKSNDYGCYGDCIITTESGINLLEHERSMKCPLVERGDKQCQKHI